MFVWFFVIKKWNSILQTLFCVSKLRCSQNQYTAVSIHLEYSSAASLKPCLYSWHVMGYRPHLKKIPLPKLELLQVTKTLNLCNYCIFYPFLQSRKFFYPPNFWRQRNMKMKIKHTTYLSNILILTVRLNIVTKEGIVQKVSSIYNVIHMNICSSCTDLAKWYKTFSKWLSEL